MPKNENLTENYKLMEEWDYEKNGDLSPKDCNDDHQRFVWWKCASVHSWQARISARMNGEGCPYDCAKRRFVLNHFHLCDQISLLSGITRAMLIYLRKKSRPIHLSR